VKFSKKGGKMSQSADFIRLLQAFDSPVQEVQNFPVARNQQAVSDDEVLEELDNPLEILDMNNRRNAVKDTTWHS
jgi:hypothetical protein